MAPHITGVPASVHVAGQILIFWVPGVENSKHPWLLQAKPHGSNYSQEPPASYSCKSQWHGAASTISKQCMHKVVGCWDWVCTNVRLLWTIGAGDCAKKVWPHPAPVPSNETLDVFTGPVGNIKGLAHPHQQHEWDSVHFEEGRWFICRG